MQARVGLVCMTLYRCEKYVELSTGEIGGDNGGAAFVVVVVVVVVEYKWKLDPGDGWGESSSLHLGEGEE